MIAIAVQTAISMFLCFAIGFVTAWIIRGRREQRGFEEFFATWRSRYNQLERDCDGYLARINALQKDLIGVNQRLTDRDASGVGNANPSNQDPNPTDELIRQ